MHPALAIPSPPPTLARLALALTGFRITGQPGAFGTVVGEHPACVPAGPYTITDAAGVVVQTTDAPNWAAERIAVRTWRQRVEATDYCLTRDAVAEQLRLKVELRAVEAHAAALECRIKAIDAEGGCAELAELDAAMETYGKAVDAWVRAVREVEAYRDESLAAAA